MPPDKRLEAAKDALLCHSIATGNEEGPTFQRVAELVKDVRLLAESWSVPWTNVMTEAERRYVTEQSQGDA
jgi:hypothetical protein